MAGCKEHAEVVCSDKQCTSHTQSIVYAHCLQMISLYRDPTGERVFSKTMPTSDLQSSTGTKQHRLSEVVSANFAVQYVIILLLLILKQLSFV